VHGQGNCSWKEGHYFATSPNIHQENYLPQATWIKTFLEVVADKSTGLPLFSELAWFVYKVSGVMCSTSVCDHRWSIEGWIHSQRRNRLDQKLVEKLVHTPVPIFCLLLIDKSRTKDLLPWDIELVIDESVDEKEEEPEV
jgi:hypothetical protein